MNEAYLRVTGRSREMLVGTHVFEAFPSDPESVSGRMLRTSLARVIAEKRPDNLPLIPYPIARPDGMLEERFWSATNTPLFDEAGNVAFIMQHTVDVTELHLLRSGSAGTPMQVTTDIIRRADAVQIANEALDRERTYLRSLFAQAPGFMAVLGGADYTVDIANPAYLQLVGQRDIIGRPLRQSLPEIADQGFFEILDEVYATAMPYIGKAVKVLLQREAGEPLEVRYIDLVYQPILDSRRAVGGIFVQGHDITEQKLAETAAVESEARFRTLAQSMPNHVWTALPDGNLDWFNDQVYEYSGAMPGTLDGSRWSDIVHPDDIPEASRVWAQALRSGNAYQTEFRLRRHDGIYCWHIARAAPIRDAEGNVVRWIGTNTDIDRQKTAEAVLAGLNATLEERVEARTAELLQTQEALRQSQKMEAIGNLAGGIAHDFNNLLQVIGGNLQLLAKDLSGKPEAEQRLQNAFSGVVRGAKLASQLLSFGRRQPLAPKVVNIGRLVREMDDILRRALGEAIEIETAIAGGLWNTLIDPGNVENAVLNLAINARDAMAGNGRLTIEASNAFIDDAYARANVDATAGQYVLLAVTDTGCGMPPEILANAFEPFFSTKPEGKGTGLGLSMVYGFVKQSGGHVKIYSEPGNGTTVRIYLPRSMQSEDPLPEVDSGPLPGGTETVLVAEDDAAVREIAVGLLGELGYRTLKARDAESALAIVESGMHIDVLFTDVVMPGPLSSPELARKSRLRLPGLAVLFTSGYTENSIVHGGRLDPGVNLLSKPYTREMLAMKLRQVLAERQRPAASRMTVLVCEDDALIRLNTTDMLQELGCDVVEAASATQALVALRQQAFDVLVTDVGLPDMSGVDLARQALQALPNLRVVFATGHAEVDGAEAIPRAVVLVKPYDMPCLQAALDRLRDDPPSA